MTKMQLVTPEIIQTKILTLRGQQVILDREIATLYGVETKVLNQAVKRNKERFPYEFMFQLTDKELNNWKSQIVTSNNDKMGLRKLPFAFTEQGVAMLSSVLKSHTAISVSIQIMNAFIAMRRFISMNGRVFQRLDALEIKQIETDNKLNHVLDAIETKDFKPKQGVFFDGQVFDAYLLVNNIIKTARKSIVLVDNYIDESVLVLFCNRKKDVSLTIFTKEISKKLELDIKKHNEQYQPVTVKVYNKSHDRFLVIDNTDVYHVGASLKDLGKKWFAFSRLDQASVTIIDKLKGLL